MDESGAFYCNPGALSAHERERHKQLTGKLITEKLETKELENGYAFRLRGKAVSLQELGEWVSAERKCCPFFGFEIDVHPDSGPLWLKLKGAEGIKPFIRRELGIEFL